VLHPVIVSALAIWLLNDHVLKHHCGSGWTGKLSDVVALVAGPVVLAGLWSLATRRPQHVREAVAIAAALLALVMVLINTWPVAAAAYCWLLDTASIRACKLLEVGLSIALVVLRTSLAFVRLCSAPMSVGSSSCAHRRPQERWDRRRIRDGAEVFRSVSGLADRQTRCP
jgi:hypothetical protein